LTEVGITQLHKGVGLSQVLMQTFQRRLGLKNPGLAWLG
jgi:hypothetical protein